MLECCGGTELGAMYVGGNLVQPQAFAAFSTPGMTFQIFILDDSSNTPYVSACMLASLLNLLAEISDPTIKKKSLEMTDFLSVLLLMLWNFSASPA